MVTCSNKTHLNIFANIVVERNRNQIPPVCRTALIVKLFQHRNKLTVCTNLHLYLVVVKTPIACHVKHIERKHRVNNIMERYFASGEISLITRCCSSHSYKAWIIVVTTQIYKLSITYRHPIARTVYNSSAKGLRRSAVVGETFSPWQRIRCSDNDLGRNGTFRITTFCARKNSKIDKSLLSITKSLECNLSFCQAFKINYINFTILI